MPTAGYLSLIGLLTAIAGGGLAVSLVATNPAAIGPVGVTLWFIALLVGSAGGTALALFGGKTYLNWHTLSQQRLRYSLRQGLLIGGWLTVLLALASLRQLSLRDALLLGLILAVVELFFRLRRP